MATVLTQGADDLMSPNEQAEVKEMGASEEGKGGCDEKAAKVEGDDDGDAGKRDGGTEVNTEEEDGDDSEIDDTSFNYAALEEAQRLASVIDERAANSACNSQGMDGAGADQTKKRKQRGGCKESQKRRKRQRRDADIQRAKEVGVSFPNLHSVPKASVAAPSRRAVSYADVDIVTSNDATKSSSSSCEPPAASSASANEDKPAIDDPKTAAAVLRVTREADRKAKVIEAQRARTLFITNLSFKITEQEIHDWLDKCGKIQHVHLSKDKATNRLLGFGHVMFDSTAAVLKAINSCDKFELRDRVMRVGLAKIGERLKFELPQNLQDDIRFLLNEALEGVNLSRIKDEWQKRHKGEKFDVAKFGFKNFSSAIETIEGVCLEIHLEKKLTNLAFVRDSPAHVAFLENKRRKELEEKQRKEKEELEKRKTELLATDTTANGSSEMDGKSAEEDSQSRKQPPFGEDSQSCSQTPLPDKDSHSCKHMRPAEEESESCRKKMRN